MHFPVIFNFGGIALSAHFVFEILAYISSYYCYKWLRSRYGDPIPLENRWTIIVAAAIGALAGSHLLATLDQSQTLQMFWAAATSANSGKTIVGGLLGAWFVVEISKRASGISVRTGDLFAVPLCVGIAIGRIGCFLAGLEDNTYGNPTRLPWGIDFGDGIHRQPTQLYEIVFISALGLYLWLKLKQPHKNGSIFRQFLVAYLFFRLLVDFLKPGIFVFGLTMIQWACCWGLIVLLVGHFRHLRLQRSSRIEERNYA